MKNNTKRLLTHLGQADAALENARDVAAGSAFASANLQEAQRLVRMVIAYIDPPRRPAIDTYRSEDGPA